jgi:hypothetical protein
MNGYKLEIFHPGRRCPVLVISADGQGFGLEGKFAVYRPAYSARGGCSNAVRYVRSQLGSALALAFRPLKGGAE